MLPWCELRTGIDCCYSLTYLFFVRLVLSLRVLSLRHAGQQQMPNTGNMATAMHRIASTGSQEAAGREEVILDRRFQQLVVYVEHNLKQAPETFGEQHLANVVWGAAKLRLQREPLFNLVQREVSLAVSMRCALCRPAWCGFGRQRAAGSGAVARLVPRVLGFVF